MNRGIKVTAQLLGCTLCVTEVRSPDSSHDSSLVTSSLSTFSVGKESRVIKALLLAKYHYILLDPTPTGNCTVPNPKSKNRELWLERQFGGYKH